MVNIFQHCINIHALTNRYNEYSLNSLTDVFYPVKRRLFQIFATHHASFYSAGTVWMQQILVQIMGAAHSDWIEDVTNRANVPWLEGRFFCDPLRERPEPRLFNSHLPPDMLPHGVKNKQIKVQYSATDSSLIQTNSLKRNLVKIKQNSASSQHSFVHSIVLLPLGCVCLEKPQRCPGVHVPLFP